MSTRITIKNSFFINVTQDYTMLLNKTLFFIHLPKTAGTSFRFAAINYFGKDACHFDYGSASPDTSDSVKQYAYERRDFFQLQQQLHQNDAKFLAGHVGFRRYNAFVPASNVVSFIRDPLKQFISHYEHKMRHHDYKETLETMLHSHAGPELQARNLQGIPIEAYGFIGITERYEESLMLFNHFYQTNLEYSTLNTNPNKKPETYRLPEHLANAFKQSAALSYYLYNKANKTLDKRLIALRNNYEYAHATVTAHTATHVEGFAFYARNNNAVQVQLLINGKVIRTSFATDERPNLRSANVSRNGYVGFKFALPPNLGAGDDVYVRIPATNQEVYRSQDN